MKKLNKKGFTLVELLAVIVILALLIVVVANTALPAMNNAKKNTLDTYAKRVVEQAKTLYIADNNKCSSTACNLIDTMGVDAPVDQYKASLTVTYDSTAGYKVDGWVVDYKNKNIAKVDDNITSSKANGDMCPTITEETTCKLDVLSDVCQWNSGACKVK